jgi:hypothetical protein
VEHPLIGNIDELSESDIIDKITELNKKYYASMRLGNSHLTNQVGMALETYRNKLSEKQRKRSAGDDFEDKINIS